MNARSELCEDESGLVAADDAEARVCAAEVDRVEDLHSLGVRERDCGEGEVVAEDLRGERVEDDAEGGVAVLRGAFLDRFKGLAEVAQNALLRLLEQLLVVRGRELLGDLLEAQIVVHAEEEELHGLGGRELRVELVRGNRSFPAGRNWVSGDDAGPPGLEELVDAPDLVRKGRLRVSLVADDAEAALTRPDGEWAWASV